jgi:hypothetical protein
LSVGTLVAPDPEFTRTAWTGNERWRLHLGSREAAATMRKVNRPGIVGGSNS